MSVVMFKKKTKQYRNFSVGNLTQLHTGSYRPGTPFVLGLGGGSYDLTTKLQFEVKTQGSLSCVKVASVEGRFTVEPLMLIARDYRQGSCEYNAVLEHEKKHLSTLLDFQQEYARKFKIRLKKILKDVNTSQVASTSQTHLVQEQIKNQINTQVQAYFDQITPILQRRQQKVDSPEEYRRVAEMCDNWD